MAKPPEKFLLPSILRAASALAAALALMSLTIGLPTPAVGGGTGWCTDYEGNNFPCYDDSSDDSYGGGYGGGGCASYDQSYYDSGPSYVGEYHSQHPNVVWDGEFWAPESGFEWVSDDSDDYRVQRIYGSSHPSQPNVVYDGEHWAPESGYEWMSDDPDDYRVQRIYGSAHPDEPNVEWGGDGWSPMDGYTWASDDPDDFSVVSTEPTWGDTHPDEANVWWNGDAWEPAEGYSWASDDPDDFRVVTTEPSYGDTHPDEPNAWWDGDGWTPADGYTWASDDPDDFSVVEVYVPSVGETHPDSDNVVWTGENWSPAEGFTWLNDEAGDYRVVAVGNTETEMADAVPLLRESVSQLASLHINDVPSPSGYKSESERRAQLAALSDQHIDDQLAHIQRTMAALGEDFRADSAALQAWYEDSRKAEEDALMASFSLLADALLDDDFAEVWKDFPKLQSLAKNGLRVISFAGPVGKLSDDIMDPDANWEGLAAYMGELTGALSDFDEDLMSKAGSNVVSLASFFIDYTYQAAKWSISRDQILMITNNLDKPNGRLEAQKSLSELQEDLFEERARRVATGQAAS